MTFAFALPGELEVAKPAGGDARVCAHNSRERRKLLEAHTRTYAHYRYTWLLATWKGG